MFENKQIKKFQKLYKGRFGITISHKEACEQGIKLIGLIELVCKPTAKVECQTLQKLHRKTKSKIYKPNKSLEI